MNTADKFHELIFLGGPTGVGKSTLAKELVEIDTTTQQIGAGDLIRDVRAGFRHSKYTGIIQEAISKKELVPPEVFSGLIHEGIQQADIEVSLSLIDGFPYSELDWNTFVEQMKETEVSIKGFVALNASLELCVDRMEQRGVRGGERVRVLQDEKSHDFFVRRYDEYSRKKELIVDIFMRSGVPIVDIDASRSGDEISEVFRTTIQSLRKDK